MKLDKMHLCDWVPVPRGADYICHFLAGFIIALIVTLIFTPLVGVIVGSAVAVGKELYDYKSYGVFDFWDLFFTLCGVFAGVVVLHLVLTFLF